MSVLAGQARAWLEVIDYERLQNGDADEIAKLLRTAQRRGIFFLDLRGPSSQAVLNRLPRTYDALLDFFKNTPKEDKIASSIGQSEYGYAQRGDVQTFDIPRAKALNGIPPLPSALTPVGPNLSELSSFCDAVTRKLFTWLSLALEPPASLAAGSNPREPGRSLFQLGYSAAPAGRQLVPPHRDEGLVTLLFYGEASLEVPLDAEAKKWGIVEPIDGHHLVYVGEALQSISGGRIPAPLHRVIEPKEDAYLAVYLLHPGPH